MKYQASSVRFFLALILGLICLIAIFISLPRDEAPDLLRASPLGSDDEEAERLREVNLLYAQRAYPLQSIPAAARHRAVEYLEREEARLTRFRANSKHGVALFSDPEWTSLGPAPIGQGQTFGSPRVAVSGRISAVALDPGYNGTSNQTVYIGAAQGGVWRSRDNGATWTPLTDDQPSLAMGALAIDPTNPNVIYAGTGEAHLSGDSYYGAGLLKSTDGGGSWTQITGPVSTGGARQPAFLNSSFHTLAIDPVAPQTLFAATETAFISSAAGATDFAPESDYGIWKSIDGGLTWRNVNPPNSPAFDKSGNDVLIDPLNHNRVYAAVKELGVYRSNSGGEPGSWEKLANGLPATGVYRIKLAAGPPLAPSTNATLYAAIGNNTNFRLLGLYRSTDGGTTWAATTNPAPSIVGTFYSMTVAVDPTDANVIYYGAFANALNTGGTFWRSRDGGVTWADLSGGNGVTGGLHADTHWVTVSPANRNILFTANDGGIWRSDNAAADSVAWTSLNQSLNITQFYTIALHPTDRNVLLGGTQDNGTDRYTGNLNWIQARGGDGGAVLIDQSNPQVMYHTFLNRNNAGGASPLIGPEISFDGGNTWARRGCFFCMVQPGNFNPSDRVSDFAPMAQHTGFSGAGGNVIYFGTHRLYRSADQGLPWMGLGASADGFGADLTKNIAAPNSINGFPSYLSAIAVHPTLNSNANPPGEVVWVGTGDGLVQVTTNAGALAGATFANVTRAPLPNRFVTDIALDPNDQQRAAVAYSGFNANTPNSPGHVFLTTDQGASWTNISGNLPDIPVNSIMIDAAVLGALYVGTDLGVFQSLDGGSTWSRLGNGMPKVAVFMLRYHAATRSLIAATHGRGVYRLKLPNAVASVSAASYLRDSVASESIVAAFGTGLATTTQVASSQPLPTELAGTKVIVRDSAGVERLAPLFFVAPAQVNYQMPAGVASGLASVALTSGDGTRSIGSALIDRIAPGLFAANSNGQGVAAAVAVRVKTDGSQIFEPVIQFDAAQNRYIPLAIDLGPPNETIVLVLFGTGIRNRGSQSIAGVKLGGADAQVLYASVAPGFVGLDQVNAIIPRTLIGRGEIDVNLSIDGKAANTVKVAVK